MVATPLSATGGEHLGEQRTRRSRCCGRDGSTRPSGTDGRRAYTEQKLTLLPLVRAWRRNDANKPRLANAAAHSSGREADGTNALVDSTETNVALYRSDMTAAASDSSHESVRVPRGRGRADGPELGSSAARPSHSMSTHNPMGPSRYCTSAQHVLRSRPYSRHGQPRGASLSPFGSHL